MRKGRKRKRTSRVQINTQRSRKVRIKPIEERVREGMAVREAGGRRGNKWLKKWEKV